MAAGLGFKTFTTGEVLTADNVNGYLMQGVLVFASAAARTTAITSPQEGQYSYLKDTNALEYYDGAAWVGAPVGDITAVTAGTGISGGGASGDVTITNSMATTIDAKGDLIVGTADNAFNRLAVGTSGSVLVSDSAATTGLNYIPTLFAGKNKIINGDFGIWQRGTSFASPASFAYTADRFVVSFDGIGSTKTISQQTFTAGTAPVSGYESQYYLRWAQTVAGTLATYNSLNQYIEDVRTFAAQTITVSFYAKSAAALTGSIKVNQYFGTGGSAQVSSTPASFTTTTSWARYTATVTLASIAGKTIGTGNFLGLEIIMPLNSTFTFDVWGVQVEAGSTATTFQTATGTVQGELAACQRYYWRSTATGNYSVIGAGGGNATGTTTARLFIANPVNMRTTPNAIDYGGALAISDGVTLYATGTFVIQTASTPGATQVLYTHGTAVLTQYRWYNFQDNNANTAYLGVSAEL